MRSIRCCLLLSLLLFSVSAAYGQGRARASVDFRKIDLNNVPTPVYKPTSHSGASSSLHEWLQIYAEYSAVGGQDGWIDELELRWSVLIKEQQGRYLLFHTTATYQDVEADKGLYRSNHHAVVYIRPAIARRYCGKDRIPRSDIWVHVEVAVDGRVVGREDYSRSRAPAANWWQAKDNRAVKVLEGALLTRDKTPFAPLDYDYYEHLKGTQGR